MNKRGTNIEGANVQWGDGTTHQIFMPGTKDTVYINLHAASGVRSRLTFDYDGPVTLGAPIGGGRYHDTLAAPGAGDIVIAGTRGNDVTFAAPQYYDGSTTVEKGAVLRLGSGKQGGDGGLLTGTAGRRIVDDGTLVARNVSLPVKLSHLSGKGSLVQSGAATTTLTGAAVTYTGTTTVSKGTLALRSGATLVHSKSIRLTSAGARLDVGTAGLRVATDLTGVGTVKGSVTNDSAVTTGLTVTGNYTQSTKGELILRDKPLKVAGRVALAGDLDLSAAGTHPAQTVTILQHTGGAPTTGAFKGLREGSRLKLADTTYRISYRGGDGNDVVLTTVTASSSSSPTAHPKSSSGTTVTEARTENTARGAGFGWWPYALGLGLLGALLVPATKRTRGGNRRGGGGGRHAA